MPFIEAPTTFYMGKRFDPNTNRLADEVVYYDSRDLTTHAVVVGMTGSGKTGLCITLLEEAILDNIPAIVIDPKGDITNLLLTFPELRAQDFRPWVNADDAARAGQSLDDYASDVAQRWKDGLQSWSIVPDRLKWLQLAARYNIYTPGSDAGLPISILASLKAPREGFAANEEANRERINGTVTALLSLIGRNSRPLEDADHVLMANIFEHAWRQGRDLSLEDVILQVQQPPFEKLGVFPVDKYISEKKRFNLAMELNNIIAAPSFQSWIRGEPLDIQKLLYQPNGRPQVSVFYIAHLSQAERMFIITLLLENMLSWMRTLSGTSSLRALLYIDEMFGYFPPYPKNPPTKDPILRLLKQARAFGIGTILATQNPGDLDYKGLSNAGTWFIGRLQSDNDRKKVMSGLESLAAADNGIDIKEAGQLIADIEPRVFLMQNVHNDGGPVLVHTRWAMNYLRGPLTRKQIRVLMSARRAQLMQELYQQQPQQQQQPMGGTFGSQQAYPNAPAGYGQAPGFAPPPPTFGAQGAYGQQQGGQFGPPPGIPGQQQGGQFGPPPGIPGQQQGGQFGPPPGIPGQQQGGQFGPPQGLPGQQQGGQFGGNFGAQGAYGQPQGGFGQGYEGNTIPYNPQQQNFNTQASTQQMNVGNVPQGYSGSQPALPSDIQQYFLPEAVTLQQAISDWEAQNGTSARGFGGGVKAYKPVILGQASVRYQDKKTNLYTSRTYAFHVPDYTGRGLIQWEDHVAYPVDPRNVSNEPQGSAAYGEVPVALQDAKAIKALEKEMIDMLYNTANLTLPFNPALKIYGNPDEDYSAFQAQVHQAAREGRDKEVDKLTAKYEKLLDSLDDKLRKKIRELDAEKKELSDRRKEELFTGGEAALSLLRGRTTYTLSRASRATRMRRQTKEDLAESREVIDELEGEMQQLEQQFEQELAQVNQKWTQIANQIEDYLVTPYKKDIKVELFGIGWVPQWYTLINQQPVMMPAY